MNTSCVDKIASALLYEGYMLYPYRPSIKNRKRWTFGCIHPESPGMQTECLVEGDAGSQLAVEIRFLQLIDRQVARLVDPAGRCDDPANLEIVPALEVDGVAHHAWQEAVERRFAVASSSLLGLAQRGRIAEDFAFPATVQFEPLGLPAAPAGALVRCGTAISGTVTIAARQMAEHLLRLTVRVGNNSPAGPGDHSSGEPTLESLVAVHMILSVRGGQFVSSIDPPAKLQPLVEALRNEGSFPILVGEAPDRSMMLASPIILYDYPEIAAESPHDMFDATEIDEILGLRIMTLTDDEKAQIDSLDERTRAVLMRTHLLPDDDRRRLHGAIRGLKTVTQDTD